MDVRNAIAVSLEFQKIKEDANSSTRQKKQQLRALRRALSRPRSAVSSVQPDFQPLARFASDPNRKKETTDESAYRRWLRRHKYITFAR